MNITALASKAFLICFISLILSCTQSTDPIRIGVNPWPGYSYLYLADALGYFKEENVDVELVDFLSLADSSRAFELNQIDAWGTTPVELLIAQEHSNRKTVAIWVTDISRGGDVILAQTEFTSITDLKGKRIGIEPATVDVILLSSALESASLKISDITIVPMSHNAMKVALEKKLVDAVTIYPPESIDAVSLENIHKVYDSKKMDNPIIDLIATDKHHLDQRLSEWKLIISAYKRAEIFAQQNPQKANAIISRILGISIDELSESLLGVKMISAKQQADYLDKDTHLDKALSLTMTALINSGMTFGDLNVKDMYDNKLTKN